MPDTPSIARPLRQAVPLGLLLLAVLVPLCVSPLFQDYTLPKQVLVELLVVLLAVLWILHMALAGEIRLIASPLYPLFLAFLAICLLSLFGAHNLPHGIRATFRHACYFFIPILVFHTVREVRGLHRLALGMVLAGGVVALIGFLQYIGVWSLYSRGNHPLSTIGNVTFVAGYYNVVFPVSLSLLFLYRKTWQRIALAAPCVLIAGHLLTLGSRGGWLGLRLSVKKSLDK